MKYHANAPDWCVRESLRLFPLDLAKRIEWLDKAAHYSVSEPDRHESYRRIRIIRNGEGR